MIEGNEEHELRTLQVKVIREILIHTHIPR